MYIKFAGVGHLNAAPDFWQTSAIIKETPDGASVLLIDCGSDSRFSLKEAGVSIGCIDGVYITHLHSDHIGSMEWLALNTKFNPKLKKPTLFALRDLMLDLWYNSLRGGLETLQGEEATLTTFFDCKGLSPNESFTWGGIHFQPVQTVHVVSGFKFQHSYGLMIDAAPDVKEFERMDAPRTKIFFTGDTQFCPEQIMTFYRNAGVIFQDCETALYRSGVHAHYHDLCKLPPEIKAKMWLMHYDADGPITDEMAKSMGFLGFVKKGQEFEF